MHPRSAALLASLCLLAGCKTVHVLGPGQLQKLDGYDTKEPLQQPPQLATTSGEVVTFARNNALAFVSPTGTQSVGHLQRIGVRPEQLVATLTSGRSFSVELRAITEVQVLVPSPWKTTLLVIGSILLGGAAIAGVVGLLAGATHLGGFGGGLGP